MEDFKLLTTAWQCTSTPRCICQTLSTWSTTRLIISSNTAIFGKTFKGCIVLKSNCILRRGKIGTLDWHTARQHSTPFTSREAWETGRALNVKTNHALQSQHAGIGSIHMAEKTISRWWHGRAQHSHTARCNWTPKSICLALNSSTAMKNKPFVTIITKIIRIGEQIASLITVRLKYWLATGNTWKDIKTQCRKNFRYGTIWYASVAWHFLPLLCPLLGTLSSVEYAFIGSCKLPLIHLLVFSCALKRTTVEPPFVDTSVKRTPLHCGQSFSVLNTDWVWVTTSVIRTARPSPPKVRNREVPLYLLCRMSACSSVDGECAINQGFWKLGYSTTTFYAAIV